MTAALLLGLVVLVFVNGFFVAAEFALVRARRSRVEAAAGSHVSADLVLRQMDEISEYLSACQLGITLASIGIGFLGEPAIVELIQPQLNGAHSHGVALGLSLFLAYALTTALHITIGEQVPKIYAISRAERVAGKVARPLHLFAVVFHPAVNVLNRASNAMLKLLGVDAGAEFEEGGSPEDLKLLITQSQEGGTLDAQEAEMLSGVFELHELQARHVLTPMHRVVTVDIEDDLQTAASLCAESGHTRLPVTRGRDPGRIAGILHAGLILGAMVDGAGDKDITALTSEALIVPETKRLDKVLGDQRVHRTSLAVVVDEYGRTVGIVTVEDILEEVVGEILDETDEADKAIQQASNGEWVVGGHVPVTDLADHGIDLPQDDRYTTIGGLILTNLARLPVPGDTVELSDVSLQVETVSENRVGRVRVGQRPGEH